MIRFLKEKFCDVKLGDLFFIEIEAWVHWLVGSIPGTVGIFLRNVVYGLLIKKKGMIWIQLRVTIVQGNRLSIGKNCGINCGTYINAKGGIVFGDHVLIGANVVISSGKHPIEGKEPPVFTRPTKPCPIFIEDDVWIANAIIMPGIRLWKITVIDTGLHTMTGGKIKRVVPYLENKPFLLTYGDGLADINVKELVRFHNKHGRMVTMSAYHAQQCFGVLDVDKSGSIKEFREKTKGDGNLINIGYMVCNPEFTNYILGDETILEKEPLETAAAMGQLMAYRHEGFWQCMDTVREKEHLEKMWASEKAPWAVWQ